LNRSENGGSGEPSPEISIPASQSGFRTSELVPRISDFPAVASPPPIPTLGRVIRNLILDWSGTLVDDLPAVWRATNHVFREAGVPEMSLERFRAEFCLPFKNFYDRHVPNLELARLEEWFHVEFRRAHASVTRLPHVSEFMEFARERGYRMFLLSSLHPGQFAAQPPENRFEDYLEKPYVGVWDKRTKIHEILQDHGLDPAETLFIGDMEHDVVTARHGGIHSCAVLTGYNGLEQLRAAEPDLIVEHLGELREILARHGHIRPSADDTPALPAAPIVTVGALIFHPADGTTLLVRTHKWSNLWGIPGGKVKYGERCDHALERELLEETGLAVDDIRFVLVQDCIHSREFYRDAHFVLLNYTCRARNPVAVKLNDEAREFRWLAPSAALESLPLNTPTRVLLESLASRC